MVSIPVSLTRLADPVGNDTVWNYDKRYRVVSEMNELGKTRYFQHDAVGNLTQQTDRNGRVIEFTYDNLDRVTQEQWLGTGARTLTFVYDAYARLNSAGDVSATYRYAYDVVGQVALETQEIAGLSALAYEHTYDINGNLLTTSATLGVTVTLGDPPMISGGAYDFKNEFTYDNLNRLTKLTQQSQSGGNAVAEKRVDFAYNAVGQFTSIDRYESLTTDNHVANTAFTYDAMNRLATINHTRGATTFAGYTYGYDAASRITSINSTVDGLTTYSYDNTDQLTGADNASPRPDEAYSFDANGNRTMSGYVVGANNRITTDGTYNLAYDDEGNLISKTVISSGAKEEYTWDHRNRLSKVTFKDGGGAVIKTVDQVYDVFNRWIRRILDSDGPGPQAATDTFFSHLGDQIALEFDGGTAADVSHRYLWGPAVDQILADEQVTSVTSAGNTIWALTDHLNSARDLADFDVAMQTTTVVNHRIYDAFGKLTSQTNGSFTILVGWTGRPSDESTGLQNNLNRWYAAILGEWMSEDPIGFAGRTTNLGEYAYNSPVMFTDPAGKVPPLVPPNAPPDVRQAILDHLQNKQYYDDIPLPSQGNNPSTIRLWHGSSNLTAVEKKQIELAVLEAIRRLELAKEVLTKFQCASRDRWEGEDWRYSGHLATEEGRNDMVRKIDIILDGLRGKTLNLVVDDQVGRNGSGKDADGYVVFSWLLGWPKENKIHLTPNFFTSFLQGRVLLHELSRLFLWTNDGTGRNAVSTWNQMFDALTGEGQREYMERLEKELGCPTHE